VGGVDRVAEDMKTLLSRIKTFLLETDITYLMLGWYIAGILAPLLLSYAFTLIFRSPIPDILVRINGCFMGLIMGLGGAIQIIRREAPGLGPGYPVTGLMAVVSGFLFTIFGFLFAGYFLFSFFFS
jgi:hypothetical protein